MNGALRESRTLFTAAVISIIVIAAVLRLYGVNWAGGAYVHPDERHVVMVLDQRLSIPSIRHLDDLARPARSPLNTRSDDADGNPRSFAYGSLPLLVTLVVANAGSLLFVGLSDYESIGLVGRFLTALVDTIAVLVTIGLARLAFGRLTALLAGILAAGTVLSIQLAHFFTTDAWATLFTVAVLYACYRVIDSFELRWSLIAAALGGAALATKVSIWPLAIPIIVATGIGARCRHSDSLDALGQSVRRIAVSTIPSILVFAVFEPYAIWRPRPFIDDIIEQWNIVNGHLDVPFTRQFVGTTPVIYEIDNLVRWGLGPAFGLLSLVAVGFAVWRAFATRDSRYILLLSWAVPYFLVIATSEARFIRYSAPLVPVLAILSGDLLARYWRAWSNSQFKRVVSAAMVGLVVVATLTWAVAFTTIYGRDHPYLEASTWIYANAPDGSTLTHELWDDRLPVPVDGQFPTSRYDTLQLDMYGDRNNDAALAYAAEFLSQADYIVLATQRVSDTVPKSPWRYPVQIEYYRMLEDERLGYRLVFESTNRPGLLGRSIDTRGADESFSVFDHPPVRIYEKVDELSERELRERLAAGLERPWSPTRYAPEPSLMLPEPVSDKPAASDLGWSSSVTKHATGALVVWLLVLASIGVAGLVPAMYLFQRFADGGIGFVLPLGMLLSGYVLWLMWSLDVLRFTALWAAAIIVAVAGIGAWTRRATYPKAQEQLRTKLLPIICGVGVFFVAFSLFLLFRAVNPDLWHPIFGGEKPMEIAYIQAVARSATFPPYDPWFSDGYINYYYFGFFLVAMLWKLTGVPVEMAFQLTVATWAGMVGWASYGIGATLGAGILRTRRPASIISAGVLAATLTLFAGNLHGLADIANNRELRVDFWGASRTVDFAITEFPYFTYLWGDLHPHVLAAPFFLAVIALALAWVQSGARAGRRWTVIWTITSALAVGAVAATNSWDTPTAGILVLAAVATPVVSAARFHVSRLQRALIVLLTVGVGAWLLFLPFHSLFVSAVHGVRFTSWGTAPPDLIAQFGLFIGVAAVAGAIILYDGIRAPWWPAHAAIAIVAAGLVGLSIMAVLSWSRFDGPLSVMVAISGVVALGAACASLSRSGRTGRPRLTWIVASAPLVLLVGILAAVRPSASISIGLFALALLVWLNTWGNTTFRFSALCAMAGFGVIAGTDVVYVADHLRDSDWERMNTVFKFFFHAWPLLALATTATIVWIVRRINSPPGKPQRFETIRVAVIGILAAFLAVATLNYPLFATGGRLEQRMNSSPSHLTLDGLAWMRGGMIHSRAGEEITFGGDYDAILWLRENASGNAVVLEAEIGAFVGGGSRISAYTGLPSVLGWGGHQNIQRDSQRVFQRAVDVREFYRTPDVDRKRFLLRKYRVDYVIVGDVERLTILPNAPDPAGGQVEYYASEDGVMAIDQMVGSDLELVFKSEGTSVYRVMPFEQTSDAR